MYRDFTKPTFAGRPHSVADWVDWMNSQGVLIPTAPRPYASCEMCAGAVKPRDDGYSSLCPQCANYRTYLDAFVPISYSTDSGLESLLHRYKDWRKFGWPDHSWACKPLGSLLCAFMRNHYGCIARSSRVDVATFVPSADTTRTFSHLQQILDAVGDNPVKTLVDWDATLIERTSVRPGRIVMPEAYTVRESAVRGKSVLLLDDTWTSGASMVSSAAALKKAGARVVVGVTLGRQLNPGRAFGSTAVILAGVDGRRWKDDECVLCAT